MSQVLCQYEFNRLICSLKNKSLERLWRVANELHENVFPRHMLIFYSHWEGTEDWHLHWSQHLNLIEESYACFVRLSYKHTNSHCVVLTAQNFHSRLFIIDIQNHFFLSAFILNLFKLLNLQSFLLRVLLYEWQRYNIV